MPNLIIAQAIPQGTSFGGWMASSLSSTSALLTIISGVLIFCGALRLVMNRQRPVALAAYLVLLPLPFLIALFGIAQGMMLSFTVLASSTTMPTGAEFSGGIAASLLQIVVAMLVSAPTYFVLAYGLVFGAPPTDSTATAKRTENRGPVISPSSVISVATH